MRCSRTGAAAQTRPLQSEGTERFAVCPQDINGLRQCAAVAEYGSPPSSLRSSAPHTGKSTHLASHRARRARSFEHRHPKCEVCTHTSQPRRCAASRIAFAVCGAEERSELGSERYARDFPALSEACTQAEFAGKPPQYVSTAGNPLYPRGAAAGSPFLCLLSFGEAKESEAPPGAYPGLLSSKPARAYPGQPPLATTATQQHRSCRDSGAQIEAQPIARQHRSHQHHQQGRCHHHVGQITRHADLAAHAVRPDQHAGHQNT